MFKKILIANRGEIACRVIKTARRMGIQTVAVYSEADSGALHVRLADEAYPIGPAPSAKSYLSINNIMRAINKSGAEAVHPGYGFLSENPEFAKALNKAGVAFIGPPSAAITSMGDKIKSKKLAEKAGVNVIPGHAKALKDSDEALRVAGKVGYPVMMKASAGGGGKGMRIARNEAEVREGFEATRREAKSSFGDDRIFIEKFIEQPRHIEIQVLADGHGNAVYLGERECSIQRRHQKVIEESPSPFIDAATRRRMGGQALVLARAVKYVSAGTVEFIVDAKRNFYFLEMNTRLQVEHPVTEMITGLDLVEWMIRIAAGEKLPFRQSDIKLNGWAVEARVYAEDPGRGFLPSTGRLVRFMAPDESEHLRVDAGVGEGGEISVHYDPMIAKVIAWGSKRNDAIATLRDGLDAFLIRGIAHNIAFLSALVSHPRFISGKLSTNFIDEEYGQGFNPQDLAAADSLVLILAAASIHRAYQERAAAISGQVPGHERKVRDDWVVVLGGQYHPVKARQTGEGFEVTLNGVVYRIVSGWNLGDPLFKARITPQAAPRGKGRKGKAASRGAMNVCVQVERRAVHYRLTHGGACFDLLVLNPRAAELSALMPAKTPPDMSRFLLSPMPGLLVSLSAEVGDEVKAGQELAVVEAMKMENSLKAERDGVIAAVKVKPGDSLVVDQVIIEFE